MSVPKKPIGVLIVDDSPFMRLTLQKILSQDSGIRVIDTARDGRDGILKLQALRPQVVTMDVEMPIMDGLQALEEIMRWQPTPVIILSSVTTEGAKATLKALDLGAIDVVVKPSGKPGDNLQALSHDLIEKVKAAALVNPARLKGMGSTYSGTMAPSTTNSAVNTATSKAAAPVSPAMSSTGQGTRAVSNGKEISPKHPVEIVAIGTSTGGPSALQAVLPTLPGNFPVPVLVAQHMPPGFTGPLAQRLNGLCALNVREGIHGETLKAGNVYVAQAGKQLQIQRKSGQLVLHIGEESPIPTLYRPSVDVMFLSLAKAVGKGTLGVVMTGMGSDGTKGMKELKALEGFAIAESEESCVVYGMPRSVVEAGLADRIVPLGEIGKTIVECVMRRG
ncbi:protein-glutamate methylesterase/protein-glutamine glutaminase [Desulfosporosinus shakirovi]|uniref:protein-glutamate methylesterase/protein-glutamine glutaminase n=1 Tax=Desulfosporosinus shakirovi TaxID=2885154 RepID=UPI001E647645|nr:chemotaxis response regulator protein-glutamate methylesterase [Desulfosporosinus sp. SRJS8]MCB8814140.1 chemotaxis response regulator protein-glutamate methylesterase [Desulfosporosinus sp. SRJS8]